jgi:transcriptional regulator
VSDARIQVTHDGHEWGPLSRRQVDAHHRTRLIQAPSVVVCLMTVSLALEVVSQDNQQPIARKVALEFRAVPAEDRLIHQRARQARPPDWRTRPRRPNLITPLTVLGIMPRPPMALLKGTLDVIILRTLSWGPAHGYAISRWIRQTTRDELSIEEGALYPALRRLEERGWIDSAWKITETGRQARVYRLTAPGRQQLHTELGLWTRYVTAMKRVLEAQPQGGI